MTDFKDRGHVKAYGEFIGKQIADAAGLPDTYPKDSHENGKLGCPPTVELPILGSYTRRNGAFSSSWRATFCRHLYITAPVSADYSIILIGYDEVEANRCAQNHARAYNHAFIGLSEE